MRQLVLVPGLDATHHICPSPKPQLAALSVPPLLLDLHNIGSEDDYPAASYSNFQMYYYKNLQSGVNILVALHLLLFDFLLVFVF